MSEFFTPQVRGEVQAVLDLGSAAGPLTKWNKVLDILKDAKVAYSSTNISPQEFLVHPYNRSRLGVNAFTSHRNGAKIKRVGADLAELSKATAFELMPVDPGRSAQLSFNESLVKKSNGLLAPINAGERYLTVSCSHTVQFCKAVMASCRTPEETLADGRGFLNAQSIGQGDAALRQMISVGWGWTILPWQVEAAWPEMPDLAQRALNAANTVASLPSEIEVASAIAEFAETQQSRGGSVDWQACVEAATGSNPPCSSYASVIGEYVKKFGGGAGAPLLRYLDDFSKSFGASQRLGQEFISAVTNTCFGATRNVPHLRTGLLACNLVSPPGKVIDGVSRLLVKSDIEKLKGKAKTAQVDAAEKVMADGWDSAIAMVEAGSAKKSEMNMAMGRLHSRMILFLTGKGKLGPEKKEFESIAVIEQAFQEDLKKFVDPASVKPPSQTGSAGSGNQDKDGI